MKEPTFWRNYFYHVQLLTTQHSAEHVNPTKDEIATGAKQTKSSQPQAAESTEISTPEDVITVKAEKDEQKSNMPTAATQDDAGGPTAQELREVVGLPSHLHDEVSDNLVL